MLVNRIWADVGVEVLMLSLVAALWLHVVHEDGLEHLCTRVHERGGFWGLDACAARNAVALVEVARTLPRPRVLEKEVRRGSISSPMGFSSGSSGMGKRVAMRRWSPWGFATRSPGGKCWKTDLLSGCPSRAALPSSVLASLLSSSRRLFCECGIRRGLGCMARRMAVCQVCHSCTGHPT
jgi:hypothetical protein